MSRIATIAAGAFLALGGLASAGKGGKDGKSAKVPENFREVYTPGQYNVIVPGEFSGPALSQQVTDGELFGISSRTGLGRDCETSLLFTVTFDEEEVGDPGRRRRDMQTTCSQNIIGDTGFKLKALAYDGVYGDLWAVSEGTDESTSAEGSCLMWVDHETAETYKVGCHQNTYYTALAANPHTGDLVAWASQYCPPNCDRFRLSCGCTLLDSLVSINKSTGIATQIFSNSLRDGFTRDVTLAFEADFSNPADTVLVRYTNNKLSAYNPVANGFNTLISYDGVYGNNGDVFPGANVSAFPSDNTIGFVNESVFSGGSPSVCALQTNVVAVDWAYGCGFSGKGKSPDTKGKSPDTCRDPKKTSALFQASASSSSSTAGSATVIVAVGAVVAVVVGMVAVRSARLRLSEDAAENDNAVESVVVDTVAATNKVETEI